MKSELKEYARRRDTTGPYADDLDVDALIVGAGFGGVYMLYQLRKLGLKTVIYEAGTDLGGTWRWNRYPGARVDSEVPEYEYSIPEVWKDWTWSTNYPNYEELRAYFDHVDKVLAIKKDCAFESVVVDAQFHENEGKWHVKTEDGRIAKCKYFVVAAGFAAKRYIPDFKGLETFQGVIHHSSFWPEEGVDVKGKRVAIIGTGASGVQITQELGPEVESLKVFQRTPNLAIPMGKRQLTPRSKREEKCIIHSSTNYVNVASADFSTVLRKGILSMTLRKSKKHFIDSFGSMADSAIGSATTKTCCTMPKLIE